MRRELGLIFWVAFVAAQCELGPRAASGAQFAGCYSLSWNGEVLGVFDLPLVTSLQLTTAERSDGQVTDYVARATYQHVIGGAEPGSTVEPWAFTATPTWRLVDQHSLEVDITEPADQPRTWILSGRDSAGTIVGSLEWRSHPGFIRDLTFRAVRRPCT